MIIVSDEIYFILTILIIASKQTEIVFGDGKNVFVFLHESK